MKKTLFFLAALLTFGLAANAQAAWSENFEDVTVNSSTNVGELPSGWTLYADNLPNYSNYTSWGQSWCVYNMGGWGKAAACMTYTNSTTPCDRWLVTPQITVPSSGDYKLVFDVVASQYSEKLTVMVSTTGTAKTDFTDVLIAETTLPAGNTVRFADLSTYAGQDIYVAFRCTTTDGLYLLVDNVEVTELPSASIDLVSVTAPSFVPMGGNFGFDVTVYNAAGQNMTSFDIEYDFNGGTSENVSVTGINVAPFTYYTKTISVSYPTAEALTINVVVSNPNGETDVDASNNSGSTNVTVYDPATTTERTSVMEHFTTAVCPNCPAGHTRLENAVQGQEDRVVWIAHHVGYHTDGMTINESNQMLTFFNDGGSTFAPAWMIDRNFDNNNAQSEYPGPAFFPGSDARAVLTNAISKPAFVTVNISDLNYDVDSRQLSVTVSGEFVSDMSFSSPRVSVYIMEDGIRASQSGASGLYTHNHVIRGCITNVWGDSDAITNTTAGSTFSKTYTYTVPQNWTASKCWLAAFVNDYGTNINTGRTIANGTKSGYLTTVGIENAEMASISVTTFPNPATEIAFVEAESTIHSYTMVNAMGQVVMSAEGLNVDALELDVRNLAAGIYYVTITTDNGTATQRLSVVK